MTDGVCLGRAIPPNATKGSPSSRAVALAYVGKVFGAFDIERLAASLTAWLSNACVASKQQFADAARELRRNPQAVIDVLQTFPPDREAVADVLGALLLKEKTPELAKRCGAVFTPAWLAQRVVRSARLHWYRLHRDGQRPRLIADVACGPGAFLFACAHIFQAECPRIVGIDNDPSCVAYADLLGRAIGAKWDLQCKDSLLQSSFPSLLFERGQQNDSLDHAVDILVGNPPYVRSQLLTPDYASAVRDAYPCTCKGNFDLSVAFIEHAMGMLAEGGVASYILTNKFMVSTYGEKICRKLSRDVRVLSLEDFQDAQVFRGYTTYTCVLTFTKKPPAKRFVVTRFPNGVTPDRDPGAGETTSLSTERLASHPWDFATDEMTDVLRLARNAHHPLLSDIFGDIVQGLRTGANQVFVIGVDNKAGIEDELLLPFINGEHIRRCQVQSDRLRLVYPYETNEFGEARLIGEKVLRQSYPACWAYLRLHRESLVQRSHDARSEWYAFSRSQNLGLGHLRKLLVREMMPRAEFAADYQGEITFASGYGLDATRMDDASLTLWTAILCTPVMEFVLRHAGTQLQSGWFRLLKHHLRRVRLPNLTGTARSHAENLAGAFRENPADNSILGELDALVADSFGLSKDHLRAVHAFLRDCHARSLPSHEEARRSQRASDEDSSSPDPTNLYQPVVLDQYASLHRERSDLRKMVTFVPNKETPIHRWFKYTQGFGAKLVEFLLDDLGASTGSYVLDPFAGCGTTNIVCLQKGIPSVGIELSPLMAWVASAKTMHWDADELANIVATLSLPSPRECRDRSYETSPFAEYLRKAYSEQILSQLWTIVRTIDDGAYTSGAHVFLKLGLLSIMEEVSQVRKHGSHYRYMLKTESIGLQKLNTPIIRPDADIRPILMTRLWEMVQDVRSSGQARSKADCKIICGDARKLPQIAAGATHVITSPPYLNRNNYIAQQKAELAILSLVNSRREYRLLVHSTLRSHVEADFESGPPRSRYSEVQRILDAIELTTHNNPRIPHMIAGYFEDLSTVLSELSRVLAPSARVAFVVGNSRWGGIVVPVDHILAMIGERTGFGIERIYVTRLKGNSPQQMRRYGRIPVRESIVIMNRA